MGHSTVLSFAALMVGKTLGKYSIVEGNIFARGRALWVTLETADERLVLRLDPAQLRPLLSLVEQRTKPRIERFMDPEKP
jgi:hypothetical protein